MSEKSCEHHSDHRRFHRTILTAVGSILLLLSLTILIVYLTLQPQTPKFTLNDATIYSFNASSPQNLLSTTLQVTVATENPNRRIGALYERLQAHAAYRGEQITLAAALPATYVGHGEVAEWSPVLYGESVPVSPELAAELRAARTVAVRVEVRGRVRWKVGTWVSGRYHVFVTCPAYVSFGERVVVVEGAAGVGFQLARRCSVDVSNG